MTAGCRFEVRIDMNSRLASSFIAQFGIDQLQRTGDALECIGMELQPANVGQMEHPDDVDRIALEHLRIGNIDAALVLDHESRACPGSCAGGWQSGPARRSGSEPAWPASSSSPAQKMRVRSPTSLATRKVVLHEAFDR
jgi:hypothetical protein